MSIVHIAAIECDGCSAIYQASPTGPSSAAQIRRLAVIVGWTFPAKLKIDGAPGDSFSDVCPACAPTWVPRTAPNSWRPWTANKRTAPVQSSDGAQTR
jgi:hypothetical protein